MEVGIRIAVASSGLGHVSRGIETWAEDLGNALFRRGLDVRICKGGGALRHTSERLLSCCRRNDARTARLLKMLPKRLLWRAGLASAYGIEQTTFAISLIRLLRRENVDIVHVQDPTIAMLVQRAHQAGLVASRAILGHGTEEPLEFIRKITYLQHLAPWHLDEARRSGVWKRTWCAIPNFIDVDRFTPIGPTQRSELGIPSDGIVLLTAAAIKRSHKRIDYLLQEFARLRSVRPQLPIWLVIAGGWEAETDELVKMGREALGDRVRFLVRFPRDRMADLYRTADLFVLCSLKEMMPIALLEATASGLPCLVHRHPIMEWIIGAGGQAIDMARPGELAAAIGTLAANRDRRMELGREARRHCVENFGRDRVVDQILDYYRFVVAHDTPAVPAAAAT